MSHALFRNRAEIGDMDRSIVRDLNPDASAYQGVFGDLFRIQSGLECLLPAGDMDNDGVPLSIDREVHECRGGIQNHRLLVPSPNRNENAQRQDFWNAISLVLECQILCSPIDPRRRKDISSGLGTKDYREVGAPKFDANSLPSTRWGFVATLKRIPLPCVFDDGLTAENHNLLGRGRDGERWRRRGFRRWRGFGRWRCFGCWRGLG